MNKEKLTRKERREIETVKLKNANGLSSEAIKTRKALLKAVRDNYDPLRPSMI